MGRTRLVLAVGLVATLALVGCNMGRRSPSGFRLPQGDADAGKAAFVELKCHTCHSVDGTDLPAPTAPRVIALGGGRVLPQTDGDITTDIILPSSHFAADFAAGATSPMPDYTRTMTVRQLSDLVAFLQSKYRVGL